MLKKKNNTKQIALGASLAAVAGFLAGVLTAPKSGKETRSNLRKAGKKGLDGVEKQFTKTQNQLNESLDEAKAKAGKLSGKTKDELNSAVDKAKVAKDKAQAVFSSVKSGEAEDKDLQKALDNAKKALANLKLYLKK